jgi:hypothetical protein
MDGDTRLAAIRPGAGPCVPDARSGCVEVDAGAALLARCAIASGLRGVDAEDR